jgi:UDP-glucose 4-epimerase
VVLVTGVARYLGAHLAAQLAADRRIDRVIGIDATAPSGQLASILRGVEVQQIDLRTVEVARLVVGMDVEAVVHLAVSTSPNPALGGRSATKEINVIGTMQLLAACQRAPHLRKVVVRSSTAAYGASFRDPAVFTEDTEPRELPRGGFARDILEVEDYVRGFCRRRSDVAATVLRFAPLIGPDADTRLARYFSQPVVPTVLGRDPLLQFLHVDDAFEVLRRSVIESHPGTFNVAGPGVLTLSQAIRRAGRVPAPVPETGIATAVTVGRGSEAVPVTLDQLELLVHGRVVDISRLVAEFDFLPRSTAEAFDGFVRSRGEGFLGKAAVRAAEEAIMNGIRAVRSAPTEGPVSQR